MQLEEYFTSETVATKFGPVEAIRIKGHRIGIEDVLDPFNAGVPPDVIHQKYYPSLRLEEIYATITYYLHNQEKIDAYLRRGEEVADAYYQEHLQKEPSPVIKRMRALRAQKLEAMRVSND